MQTSFRRTQLYIDNISIMPGASQCSNVQIMLCVWNIDRLLLARYSWISTKDSNRWRELQCGSAWWPVEYHVDGNDHASLWKKDIWPLVALKVDCCSLFTLMLMQFDRNDDCRVCNISSGGIVSLHNRFEKSCSWICRWRWEEAARQL